LAPGNSTLDRALARQFAGTSTLEAVGNPLQAGLNFRGFTATFRNLSFVTHSAPASNIP
jgi:hypothetical protein